MKTYQVLKINMEYVRTVDDYEHAKNEASVHYINGLSNVFDFCGGKLHRERCGYSGRIGKHEFVALPL